MERTSGTFTYRKYRSDADNYFGATFGMGFLKLTISIEMQVQLLI
jgi:hypothetical protein